jgi:tRNA A-37 threonylcarbamoyl transferase component Bud32
MSSDDPELTETRASAPAGSVAPAASWGGFRLLEELGRGAFGRVYRARDPTLDRDVALKIRKLSTAAEAATALEEGRMLARVRHRNVVTVFGAQQIGDEVGVWMELIRGRSLAEVVRDHGPMGPEEATLIGISLCQALAAVHGAGLLHRDVKANNVMREAGGRIVLMDLGAGRDTAVADACELAGTPAYMAPEVLSGGAASAASDLYSLGVLLFYLVTSDFPVPGRTIFDIALAHSRGRRLLLPDRRPDVPEPFVRVVEHALSPAADRRPPTAGAMMAELAAAIPRDAGAGPAASAASGSRMDDAREESAGRAGQPPSSVAAGSSPVLLRWVAAPILALIVITSLGFLTCAAYNLSLDRAAGFADDTAADWFTYGARSLVAPVIFVGVIATAVRLVVSLLHGVRRLLPWAAGMSRWASARIYAPVRQATVRSTTTAAQWLIAGHVAALVLIAWRFRLLLRAVGSASTADAAALATLRPDAAEPLVYRGLLTIVLAVVVAAWLPIGRRGAWRLLSRTTVAAGLALVAISLLLLDVPYRVLYHSDARRVDVDGVVCHEIGQRQQELLLYCGSSPPPRVRVVDEASPALRLTTDVESIFTVVPAAP